MKHLYLLGFALLTAACAAGATPNGTVDGTFRVEGKDAKLSIARAIKGEPYVNNPTIDIAFTEKDASAAKNFHFLTSRDTYGAAITITLYKTKGGSYDVISSSFGHPASKMSGGGGTGIVDVKDVKVANGEISGELYTKPNSTLFNEKLDIDLKFKVPLPK